jgi:hypothetical protein
MAWTKEETSQITEFVQNDDFIDWESWADLNNITPAQAARLAHHVDPLRYPDFRYSQGGIKCDMPTEMRREIEFLTQRLESRSRLWKLTDLVIFLGEDVAPFGMVQAAKLKPNTVTVSVGDSVGVGRQGRQSNKENTDGEGKPKERQEYFRKIWEEFERPKNNRKIWTTLRRANNQTNSAIGSEEFIFIYSDGSSERLQKKTFQNDMTELRKSK